MLALTPGEPGGIGLDLVALLAQEAREIPWVVFTDKHLLESRAEHVGLSLQAVDFNGRVELAPGSVSVIHCPMSGGSAPGQLDVANVPGVLSALEQAADACMAGRFSGLVTGPMQKSIVNDAGFSFSGHTEFLAERSGVDDVVMMLANSRMRVALATTHLPLMAVPTAVTKSVLDRRLRILVSDLQNKFGIQNPRILVAGLNPHAGENGHLGREEIEVITPVCEALRSEGWQIAGPLPADTLFTGDKIANCDAVMAMFHDQGLPVLKFSGFGEAVNITLGLPFIRTSVDHGTALDRAGTPDVNTSSMRAAIDMAWQLVFEVAH